MRSAPILRWLPLLAAGWLHAAPPSAPTPWAATPGTALRTAARNGTLDAAMLQTAWNAGAPETRQAVLQVWLEFPIARAWQPDPAVLAHETDAGVRYWAARALGEIPEGIGALADLATQETRRENPSPPLDAKTRAAILAGIAGRETDFIHSLLEQAQGLTPGLDEILRGTGRSFADLPALRQALENPPLFGGQPSALAPSLAALLRGLSERTGKTYPVSDLEDLFKKRNK